MEHFDADMPVFGSHAPDPSYFMQSHVGPGQTFQPYSTSMGFEDAASEPLPPLGQLTSAHNYTSHNIGPSPAPYNPDPPLTSYNFGPPPAPYTFDPRSAPYINPQQNDPPSSDAQRTAAPSMGPPARPRKRKAPTLRADEWEPYKARVIELHIERDPPLPLPKVKDAIEAEFGFVANVRQYRTRISQWGLDKNIKPQEMKSIVRKRQKRKLVESDKGELNFAVRGNAVESQKIDRWMKRNEIPESILYAPSPAESTPSAVGCWTVSERGSPAPSPIYSVTSPHFAMGGAASITLSPPPPSPASSISSIIRPTTSTFVGQSPAPMYQLPSTPSEESMSTPDAFPDRFRSSSPHFAGSSPGRQTEQAARNPVQYRYGQADEDRLRLELSTLEIMHQTDSNPQTLQILSELSDILIGQGRYRSAEEIIRRSVKVCQKCCLIKGFMLKLKKCFNER
ncbi:hypothetical protein AOQ84DRAFT_441071 [Glonium stellatum]|uniref:Clr5 domain-containing protein n=1 Tax=Glonium stellatum TaxID=574774 RepID=A0A8E2JQN4_9PEZI|nr:hypothetical protein AOQ84DRAFT_441071 [Glonium stellatum]